MIINALACAIFMKNKNPAGFTQIPGNLSGFNFPEL
jgi:hypothetical protein